MALLSETLRTYLIHLRCIGIEPMAVSLRTSVEDIRPLPLFSPKMERFIHDLDLQADDIFVDQYRSRISEDRHTEGSLERPGSIDYKNLLARYIQHLMQSGEDAVCYSLKTFRSDKRLLPLFTRAEEEAIVAAHEIATRQKNIDTRKHDFGTDEDETEDDEHYSDNDLC